MAESIKQTIESVAAAVTGEVTKEDTENIAIETAAITSVSEVVTEVQAEVQAASIETEVVTETIASPDPAVEIQASKQVYTAPDGSVTEVTSATTVITEIPVQDANVVITEQATAEVEGSTETVETVVQPQNVPVPDTDASINTAVKSETTPAENPATVSVGSETITTEVVEAESTRVETEISVTPEVVITDASVSDATTDTTASPVLDEGEKIEAVVKVV